MNIYNKTKTKLFIEFLTGLILLVIPYLVLGFLVCLLRVIYWVLILCAIGLLLMFIWKIAV